jgi:hypothetical protein
MKKRVYLIDIDGTICDDIKNEDSHLYKDAKVFDRSKEEINNLYDKGNKIIFFTARENKDREITIEWLDKHNFKYHDLIMDKPRCIEDDCEYVWIDNKPVRGITFKGNWSEIIEVENYSEEIKTLLKFKDGSDL